MLKLKITEEEVALAMGTSMVLPDSPRELEEVLGIFHEYLDKEFVPEWWNVHGLNEDIVNQTNNPLEKYNRMLNNAFFVLMFGFR
ncbi:Hypothetical protein PHPALM_17999 [Phytophthora palmivora]|uniref:Uncharacterized protein n=1 Tax=Phytophthora palmivora TaxID=4796 RepID=A0A2P4XKU8_9STRA|nr:Hypothetical protein PHPALM_17999 [Phytophthora palmivora]